MSAAWMWARAQVTNRLLTLIAVGILAGIAGAATLTAIAGARRTATTYDRHLEITRSAHARVTSPNLGVMDPELQDLFFDRPDVETSSQAVSLAMRPAGSDIYMLFDRWVIGALDDRFGTELNEFRIVEGRVFDHRRDDEAVITTDYAELIGVDVGDTIRFDTWTSAGVYEALVVRGFAEIPADGPSVEVKVVGIAREFESLLEADAPGSAYLTEAFTERWLGEIGNGPSVGLVRLSDGASAVPEYAQVAPEANAQLDGEIVVEAVTAQSASVDGGIDAQVVALVVFALVAGTAGAVVTYAAVSRQLSFAIADQPALSAIGMTRVHRAAGVALLSLPVALTAAAVTLLGAIPGSVILPLGTPGRIEPDTGIRVDLPVLVLGTTSVALVVLILSGAVGWLQTGRPRSPRPSATPGAGIVVARWLSPSASISMGIRTALDRGQGERALPARTTLFGCAVGLTGVTACLVFATNLQHLTVTPELYGWSADAFVAPFALDDPVAWRDVIDRMEDEPDVDEMVAAIATGLYMDGKAVPAFVFESLSGDPLNVMVSGRPPRSLDEVVIGQAVADRWNVSPGDTVSIALADGSTVPYEIVGIAAHPSTGFNYREQIAVIGDSLDRFRIIDDTPWYFTLVTFQDGVDVESTIAGLQSGGLNATGEDPVPRSVANLDEVEVFPQSLALLLGVLAAAFLLHALAVGARRRAGELAVLKALGFSRRQLRSIALAQATTIAAVGLVIGLPLGIGVGRTVWATLADNLGVVTEHRLPSWPLVWVVAVIVLANLLGLLASRRVIRVQPAAELRSGRVG
jgi:hypothetical protein